MPGSAPGMCGDGERTPVWMEQVSMSGWRGCPVAVALDDRGRAPVLARGNLLKPSPCRHPARAGTGAVVRSVTGMMRGMAGLCSGCVVGGRCHGMVSWPPEARSPVGVTVHSGRLFLSIRQLHPDPGKIRAGKVVRRTPPGS